MLSAPAGASGSSTSVATDFWKLVARTWDRQHETTHMTVNRETILEDLVREVALVCSCFLSLRFFPLSLTVYGLHLSPTTLIHGQVFEKTLLEPYLVCGPWRVTFLNEDGIDAGSQI